MDFQETLPYKVTLTLDAPCERAMVTLILQRGKDAGADFYIYQKNELLSNFPTLTVEQAADRAVVEAPEDQRERDAGIFVRYKDIFLMITLHSPHTKRLVVDLILQEDHWQMHDVYGRREVVVPDFARYLVFGFSLTRDFTVVAAATTPIL